MEVRCKKSAKGMKLAPSSSSSCFITDLPTPILMEILCRLPIETLIACKRVCKSWLHLSRDPFFTQLHHAKAPTEVCFQLYGSKDTLKLHMGNFHCLNNFDPLDVKLNTLFELPKFSVSPENTLNYGTGTCNFKFCNSCNGLLCYSGEYRNKFAMVWNPCTSEFITLPSPATSISCRYGLGFSRKTNKYKLLRVCRRSRELLPQNVVAQVCTIEKGCSWKTLGPCPSYVWEVIHYWSHPYKDPAFLHGTLHWPNDSDMNIPTFDFEDDRFGRVPLPPCFGKINIDQFEDDRFGRVGELSGWFEDDRFGRVGELSGCLFITEYTNEGMNIWLMKEYGVQDSWTKMYSLPCIVKGERLNRTCSLPVTCMDNGEILLVHNKYISSLFSYNPDVEGYRCLGSGSGYGPLKAIAYKPSLVPLRDSMLGYKVHVIALKHREMSTIPNWWTLVTKGEKRLGHFRAISESSVLPNVSAMMEGTKKRIKTMRDEVVEKQRKDHRAHLEQFEERMRNEFVKVFETLKEQIEKLKKQNRQLEEKLEDEKAKVEKSEQLKRQNQQLEERLKNEHAKVKQLEEKLQQNEQLKEES